MIALREQWSRMSAWAQSSRFAKPAARVGLMVVGLSALAVIGHVATAGSHPPQGADAAESLGPPAASERVPVLGVAALLPNQAPPPAATAPVAAVIGQGPVASRSSDGRPAVGRSPATADDPVVLNTAGVDDLRRLPGIGEKRANAILVLRERLGRFRAVEDLLKVRGIGRATLRRLRPLVRLDASAHPDAGA